MISFDQSFFSGGAAQTINCFRVVNIGSVAARYLAEEATGRPPAAFSNASNTKFGLRSSGRTMGGALGSAGNTSTKGTPARWYLASSAMMAGFSSVLSAMKVATFNRLIFSRTEAMSMLVFLFAWQVKHQSAVKSTSAG